jgi:hypothetical protein
MSERGSFVTEYIYCSGCLAAAKSVLVAQHKGLCSTVIPTWESTTSRSGELPIIAGKVGGSYPGEELHTFDSEFRDALEPLLCHELRVAVLSDTGGQEFFTFLPRK